MVIVVKVMVIVKIMVIVKVFSVSSKDIPRVDLLLDIVKTTVVAVCDDGLGLGFEFGEVIDDKAAEEGGAVFQRGLVDYDLSSLGFDALHHSLDGTLAEVVTVGFHREAVNTDCGNRHCVSV